MLAIRFNRTGKKNQASFRVVVQEKGKAPGRRHVEILGSWNPHTKQTVLKNDRILYWIGQGAEVSDSVHNLLVKNSVIEGKKRAIKMEKPAVKEAPVVVEAAPKEEAKTEVSADEVPAVEEIAKAEEVSAVAPVAEEAVKAEEAPVVVEVPAKPAPEKVVADVPAEKEAAPAKA